MATTSTPQRAGTVRKVSLALPALIFVALLVHNTPGAVFETLPVTAHADAVAPPHLVATCSSFAPRSTAALVAAVRGTPPSPATRRALACAILAEPANTHLHSLAAEYMTRYIEQARAKSTIYFHHISKAGGSGVCFWSLINGCRPPGDPLGPKGKATDAIASRAVGGNCWAGAFSDRFTWWPRQARTRDPVEERRQFSCAERAKFAEEVGLNFMANEGYLPEEVEEKACAGSDHFLTLEVLREPLSRARSHLNHALRGNWHTAEAQHCLNTKLAKGLPIAQAPAAAVNLSCFGDVHFTIANNYQTRMMAGREAYENPAGPTREHLEQAKTTLLKFDVLNLLGSRREFALTVDTITLYRVGMGLLIADRPAHVPNKRVYEDVDPALIRYIKERNALDMELFALAEDLFELDSAVYNVSAAFCKEHAKDDQGGQMSCQAFNAVSIESLVHPNDVLSRQMKMSKPFSCGCGWVGSTSESTKIGEAISKLTGQVNKQQCPRTKLFDRRGVPGRLLDRQGLATWNDS